jgi:hypothetical protein
MRKLVISQDIRSINQSIIEMIVLTLISELMKAFIAGPLFVAIPSSRMKLVVSSKIDLIARGSKCEPRV